MALSGNLRMAINLDHTGPNTELAAPTESVIQSASQWNRAITNGDAADKMNILWWDQRTLAASTAEELDLAGGVTDEFGTVLTFAKVKLIYVAAASGNGDVIQVGGAAANAFVNWVANATDIIQIRPDGAMWLMAPGATGYAVTGGTGDLLKINNANAGAAGTYDIVIAGTSA